MAEPHRRLPVGAEVVPGGVHVRVWAPGRRSVEVVPEGGGGHRPVPLDRDGQEHFAGLVAGMGAGAGYRLRVDGGRPLPDPVSRFQPEGPHGPSEVIDPATFAWTDAAWPGPDPRRAVISEVHVGTFTAEGTFAAAAERLDALAEVGSTVVELLPLADFPGRHGWGYDGVDLFAPMREYGRPDDLRAFVDRAHALGLGVILDVVYNHVGPDGNYLTQFSPTYFSGRHHSDWGETPNFDDGGSEGVREFVLANVRHWIEEYHFDGLRLDATQQIFDTSTDHILAAIAREVRSAAGRRRRTLVVAENEPGDSRSVRPAEEGGYAIDAIWNDDAHHSAMVALTGRREAYYTDYLGTPQELISATTHGFLFQGQRHAWQRARRGMPAFDVEPWTRVSYLQNHDQVANSATGDRVTTLAASGALRAMTAWLLLGPQLPMLFMGQEFGATSPFMYFADHEPDLARMVRAGRLEFLRQFPSLSSERAQTLVQDPGDPATFERSKLDWNERETPAGRMWLALHRDLLAFRSSEAAFRDARTGSVQGAVLSPNSFVLRFFGPDGPRGHSPDDRLLTVNLGPQEVLVPAPEPLLAPLADMRWGAIWSSEDLRYGGQGAPEPETRGGWDLPGLAATVLAPAEARAGEYDPPKDRLDSRGMPA